MRDRTGIHRLRLAAGASGLLLAIAYGPAAAREQSGDRDGEPLARVEDAVRRLGSAEYRAREDAYREVLAFGAEAIPPLRAALERDPDPEIRLRAERALASIPIEPEMVFVPAGEFEAGSHRESADNPRRRASTGGFWIDRFEVTNHQFRAFLEASPQTPAPHGWRARRHPRGGANHPVAGVSFEMAAAYAQWAGKRLPTELEWEKAARGTDGRRYPWGNEFEPGRANLRSDGPRPVGSHPGDSSPYGCLDMAGNVAEWVAPAGDSGDEEVVARGGSFQLREETYAEIASRHNRTTDRTLPRYECGFRCARDASPGEPAPR